MGRGWSRSRWVPAPWATEGKARTGGAHTGPQAASDPWCSVSSYVDDTEDDLRSTASPLSGRAMTSSDRESEKLVYPAGLWAVLLTAQGGEQVL